MSQYPIAIDPAVESAVAEGMPFAISLSGGKDSQATAIATMAYIQARGLTNEIVFVHADLGRIEWETSMAECEAIAKRYGKELIIVRREKGGMIERWQQRWGDNVARYENLEVVGVISPWSGPNARFCTGELKTQPIARMLKRRFGGKPYINVVGIRSQESTSRAKKPVAEVDEDTGVVVWNSILHYSTEDVFAAIAAAGMQPHIAYIDHGMTRVSCKFCVFSSIPDIANSAAVPSHRPVLRELIELELVSGFSFQSSRWLADVDPTVLDDATRLSAVKDKAAKRKAIEARIPSHLKFEKGWPLVMPTREEAELLAQVRREVTALMGFNSRYLDAQSILDRYTELMALNAERTAKKDKAEQRKRDRAAKLVDERVAAAIAAAEPPPDTREWIALPPHLHTRQTAFAF